MLCESEAVREREEQLRLRLRLRLIIENVRDYAILTTDAEDRIETWTSGAAGIYGWSAEEAVGRPGAILFTPEDRERGEPAREVETTRREGVAPDVRWYLRKNGGRVFPGHEAPAQDLEHGGRPRDEHRGARSRTARCEPS